MILHHIIALRRLLKIQNNRGQFQNFNFFQFSPNVLLTENGEITRVQDTPFFTSIQSSVHHIQLRQFKYYKGLPLTYYYLNGKKDKIDCIWGFHGQKNGEISLYKRKKQKLTYIIFGSPSKIFLPMKLKYIGIK